MIQRTLFIHKINQLTLQIGLRTAHQMWQVCLPLHCALQGHMPGPGLLCTPQYSELRLFSCTEWPLSSWKSMFQLGKLVSHCFEYFLPFIFCPFRKMLDLLVWSLISLHFEFLFLLIIVLYSRRFTLLDFPAFAPNFLYVGKNSFIL